MGLEAEGEGGGTKEVEKKEKKKEKIPLCESIGHQPLRGRCPKGDLPTNQPTDQHSMVLSRVARDLKPA